MNLLKHLSKQLLEVHFGGNWTCSNLKDQLSDVSWEEANKKIYNLNSIVALVYHINYYVRAVTKVLKGGPLDSKDKFSFNHPIINSENEWQGFLIEVWKEAEDFAELIKEMPENNLWVNMDDEKYGSYYRNLSGIIEHSHYHLGQIAIIKKIVKEQD